MDEVGADGRICGEGVSTSSAWKHLGTLGTSMTLTLPVASVLPPPHMRRTWRRRRRRRRKWRRRRTL